MSFDLLNKGRHRAKVINRYLSKVGKDDKPAVTVEFEFDNGQIRLKHFFLTENALQYAIKDLRTLGWTGNDFSDLTSIGTETEFELVIDHREHNGKTYDDIKFINLVGGKAAHGPKGMDADEARAFADRMKRLVDAIDKPVAGAPSSSTHKDDKLPF